MRAVLNVGGGSELIKIPAHYEGWRHDRLDIDPAVKPDVLLDARDLKQLPAGTYDAIYCSHNLEHYHRHEGSKVLAGFYHVLKPEGFIEIHVPDILALMKHVVENNLDVDDVCYTISSTPILVRDVIYGFHVAIEQNQNDFFAHKTGFSVKSLINFVGPHGFPAYYIGTQWFCNIAAFFFKKRPSPEMLKLLKLDGI